MNCPKIIVLVQTVQMTSDCGAQEVKTALRVFEMQGI